MTSPIHEIRALLAQFERSALRDLYWRGQDWSVFMARNGGAANPMLVGVEPELATSPVWTEPVPVVAPHLGLFDPRCAVGEMVERGGLIGVIDVLGRETEVFSATAGRVAAVCVPAHGLVEFGDPLVEIAIPT